MVIEQKGEMCAVKIESSIVRYADMDREQPCQDIRRGDILPGLSTERDLAQLPNTTTREASGNHERSGN